MSRHATRLVLRRVALAVSVLTDLDIAPHDRGVVLPGTPDVLATWAQCRKALGALDPESAEGRTALARWLLRRRWIANYPAEDLAERARPVALPVEHALHPGPGWVQEAVLGGSLDLGLGFVGIQPGQPDRVIVVASSVLDAAGLDAARWWPAANDYLERMGAMAAERFHRNGLGEVLRPMGDCDVVTLLASRVLRAAVTGGAAGMRPAVVPMRTRGWLDVNRIDPVFGPAAAAATEAVDRGFARPVLLTGDEVVQVPPGGSAALALSDPAPAETWDRPLLYR